MFMTALVAVLIVAGLGLAFKYGAPHLNRRGITSDWHVSWREYSAGLVVFAVVVTPAIVLVGNQLSVAEALHYEEFYNGVETQAIETKTVCEAGRSGSSASSGRSNCAYEYNTGHTYTYTDMCPETEVSFDEKGNAQTRIVMKPCLQTAYIYAPYATIEYRYGIKDSIGGSYSFASAYLEEQPRMYGEREIPADLPRGAPAEWRDAKARLEAGNPRPVTRMFGYDNYILAAKDDMLLPFSQDVARYKAEGILPDHTANIGTNPMTGFNASFANKVSFVGVSVADESAWQHSLMGFNAALGSKYRGDLHMVVVDSARVDAPDTYLNALKAYWVGDAFGRRAIAKNAIIVVVGVNDNKVDWARATTGMPFGNEIMTEAIKVHLLGVPLDPAVLIGTPKTTVDTESGSDDAVKVVSSDKMGVLEEVVLHTFPFKRACMGCKGDDGEIGYDNLVAKVQPPFWQLSIMVAIVALLSIVWWVVASKLTLFERRQAPDYPSYSYRSVRDYTVRSPSGVYYQDHRKKSKTRQFY
jgi:hypothetical protein